MLCGVGDPQGRRRTVTIGDHQTELVTSEWAQAGLSVAQGGGGAKLTATQNTEWRWGQTDCNTKRRVEVGPN